MYTSRHVELEVEVELQFQRKKNGNKHSLPIVNKVKI